MQLNISNMIADTAPSIYLLDLRSLCSMGFNNALTHASGSHG